MVRDGVARLTAAAVALALVAGTVAMRGSYYVQPDSQFGEVYEFGFQQGGTIDIDFRVDPSSPLQPMTFALCTLTQLENFAQATLNSGIDNLPTANITGFCTWAATLSSGQPQISYTGIAEYDDYYDVIFQAPSSDENANILFTYEFVNPGGEQLPTSQIPFKTLSLVMACLWLSQVVAWLANAVLFRRYFNPMFRFLGYVPTLNAIFAVSSVVYWRHLSSTGNDNVIAALMLDCLSGVCACMLICALALIAKGWRITRPRLIDQEWRNIALISTIFLVCYTTWKVLGGFFFLFLLILVYVLVLRYLFTAVSATAHVLFVLLRASRSLNLARSLPFRQLRAIRLFRSVLPIYIIVDIMLHVWSMMALERSPWAEVMLVDVSAWMLMAFVCVLFRLSRSSPYWQAPHTQPLMGESFGEPPEVVLNNLVIISNPAKNDSSVFTPTTPSGDDSNPDTWEL